MKKKSHNFIIPFVIYPFDLMCSFGENNIQVEKALRAYNTLDDADIEAALFKEESTQGRAVQFSSNQMFLRLRYVPIDPVGFGCLQHEIFHVVNFLMDEIGMKYETGKSDEAYAYLIGYLTKEIYSKVK